MSRTIVKQVGNTHLEHDGITKQYVVMPDRYNIQNWRYYDEDEKQEAEDDYKELVDSKLAKTSVAKVEKLFSFATDDEIREFIKRVGKRSV